MEKILLIEDDTLVSNLYIRTLSIEGYSVDLVADGQVGLEKILAGGYDLVLLDIMLPKKDGLEILKEAQKKKPQKANGPIIILTNLDQDSIIKKGFDFGANGYLIKSSMDPNQLLLEVRAFLRKGK